MNVKPFAHTVKFIAGPGFVRHIASTEEALYFLEHKWPYLEGQAHIKATEICRDVLGGKGSSEKAREAFMDALEEGRFDLVE